LPFVIWAAGKSEGGWKRRSRGHAPLFNLSPVPDNSRTVVLPRATGHTDVHFVENDLGFSQYPLVPGHELIGVVTAVGANVDGFQVRLPAKGPH
jgi:hypothetical protein